MSAEKANAADAEAAVERQERKLLALERLATAAETAAAAAETAAAAATEQVGSLRAIQKQLFGLKEAYDKVVSNFQILS